MGALKKMAAEFARRCQAYLFRWLRISDSQILLGRIASTQNRSLTEISCLQQVEFKVFSQWGQDGIIDWMIERAEIPTHLRTFVEFGVEDYRVSNTRFLLANRNWRGLIMDGSSAAQSFLRASTLDTRFDITAKSAWITRDNINNLIADAGFTDEIGLLSIDVDGNDYWILDAITVVQPIILVCEYNAVFGDIWPLSIPYDARFTRSSPTYHQLYFGASIAALRTLATSKGYRFLGTNEAGNDAFFIREDYASKFDTAIRDIVARPSKFRESRNPAGQLTYATGLERAALIANLPLVNTETGEPHTLTSLAQIYSDDWRREIAG